MADSLKQVEKTTLGAAIHTAQIEACQSKPLARATCILGANSVEDLVNVCKMKASRGGYRGATSLSWPE
jgi:hypothetical protein